MPIDEKKIASVIMTKMNSKGEKEIKENKDEYGDQKNDKRAVMNAAEDLISAVKSDDPEGVVDAMEAIVSCLMDEDDNEEENDQTENSW
jgi:hypothetical protein